MSGDQEVFGWRPAVRGDPLDLGTAPVLPKPRSLIGAHAATGRLNALEIRLFNLLLAESWSRPGGENSACNSAPAALLRRAAGRWSEDRNDELRAALLRLATTDLRWPGMAEDPAPAPIFPALVEGDVPARSPDAYWRLAPPVAAALLDVPVWAPVRLDVCARLHGRNALTLYELLAARMNLRRPVWQVGVGRLRTYLGAENSYPGFGQFRNSLLEPALRAIAERADLIARADPVKERSGSRVVSVRFHITRQPVPGGDRDPRAG